MSQLYDQSKPTNLYFTEEVITDLQELLRNAMDGKQIRGCIHKHYYLITLLIRMMACFINDNVMAYTRVSMPGFVFKSQFIVQLGFI